MLFDAVIVPLTCFAALLLRFENFDVETRHMENYLNTIACLTVIALAVFFEYM